MSDIQELIPEVIQPSVEVERPGVDDLILETVSNTIKPEVETKETEEAVHPASDEPTDDYGNQVETKERVYTESEVQAMIRKRIKEKYQEPQPIAQPIQHEAQNIDGDDWQAQLESFVDSTISKREQKIQEQRWQEQEQETQANFEVKFNTGASKYKDFEQVVMGKALTPQMVLATRGMNDPAAFIYAAAKTQAGELERIAQISDRMVQAVELGKLEERMKKSRPVNSSAPKPIAGIKGDMVEAKQKPRSIDDTLIADETARRKARLQRGR